MKKEPYIHGSRIDLSNVDDINLHKKGDIQVRNIWENQKDCIIDVRITHLDSKSYKNKDGSVVLKSQEEEKKKKYLKVCEERRINVTPFLVSTDGFIGKEAN